MKQGFSRRRCLQLIAAGIISAYGGIAVAENREKLKLAKILLGVPAGSLVDLIARNLADVIKPGYAETAYVENKTGAGGILAVRYLTNQPADGSTVYVGVSSPLTVYPETHKNLPYDPDKDLIPVGCLGTFDLALAVGPATPDSVQSLKDYFAWCKEHPEQATFGSPGEGSMLHFIGSMTGHSAGVTMRHIPYRGPGPAVLDLVGGTISAAVVPLADLTELAEEGKLRILGTTGSVRSRFVPDVPTFAEQGYGEYAMDVWIAVFLAAGTPQQRVQQLTSTIRQALEDPAVRTGMGAQLQEVKWGDAEYLRKRIAQERKGWKAAVSALDFSIDS